MRSDPEVCARIADQLEAYYTDELDASHSRAIFSHLLLCVHCRHRHWQPYVREATWLAQRFFDAMEGDDGSRPGSTVGSKDPVAPPDIPAPTWLDVTTWMVEEDPPDSPKLAHPPSSIDPPTRRRDRKVGGGSMDPGEEAPCEGDLFLHLVGMCLPAVPKPDILHGYELYLGDGPPSTQRSNTHGALIRVTVENGMHCVLLEGLSDGCYLDGAILAKGSQRPLRWTHLIDIAGKVYLLTLRAQPNQPLRYIGQIRYEGASWHMAQAPVFAGRLKTLGIPLPNGQINANLLWRKDALDAIVDPHHRRQILGLSLDSRGVSRKHAVFEPLGTTLMVRPCGPRPVVIHRKDTTIILNTPDHTEALTPGDEVQLGHHLFAVRG